MSLKTNILSGLSAGALIYPEVIKGNQVPAEWMIKDTRNSNKIKFYFAI